MGKNLKKFRTSNTTLPLLSGIGDDTGTFVLPKLVNLPTKKSEKSECVIRVSTARYHSLVLTSNSVYACGSNEHNQLGISNGKSKKIPVLKENKFKEVQLVAAQESRYAKAVTNSKKTFFRHRLGISKFQ